MTRHRVASASAMPDDVPALVEMWADLLRRGRPRASRPPGRRGRCIDRLAAIAATSALVVAEVDGEVAGRRAPARRPRHARSTRARCHAHYLHVLDGFRRRGVGKALLEAAVTFAEEVGAEHIITSVLPQLRDTNRFLARLGFGPVVLRVASVSVLRRLPASAPSGTASVASYNVLADAARCAGCGPRSPGSADLRRRAASRSRQVIREVQTRRPCSSVTATS